MITHTKNDQETLPLPTFLVREVAVRHNGGKREQQDEQPPIAQLLAGAMLEMLKLGYRLQSWDMTSVLQTDKLGTQAEVIETIVAVFEKEQSDE